MYQRAVNVACIMNETEIENREKGQAKRKFSPGGSNSLGNSKFKSLNLHWGKIRENTPHCGNRRESVISVGVNTMAHAKASRVSALDMANWTIGSPIAQRPHGTIRVILRDQVWEITRRHNEVAFQLVLPQEAIETRRSHKQEDGYSA